MEILIWLGILFCALSAAIFSGLNLAYFSVSYLRLTILAKKNNPNALKVLALRKKPNFLLSTILWGNVSYNVLLTLLTSSVMAGVTSFLFSTIVLTLVGEILPQSFFSRKALKFGAFFEPMIRFYQLILYPISWPTTLALNHFFGKESPKYYSEQDLISLIKEHYQSEDGAISKTEGLGAIHFLELDDRLIKDVGTKIPIKQTIELEFEEDQVKPFKYIPHPEDPFVKKCAKINHPEAIICNKNKEPQLILNIDAFLRHIFMTQLPLDINRFCYKPIIVTDPTAIVSEVLKHFETNKIKDLDRVYIIYWKDKTHKIIQSEELIYLLMKEI